MGLGENKIRLGCYVGFAAFFWSMTVIASAGWNLRQLETHIMEVARTQARSTYEKDIIYRRWNAGHGGVYAPETARTPANPHLRVPEREIWTPSGRVLTLINPAYMTRQAHELEKKTSGVRGHITSLKPIRPENAADPWETEALRAFERGEREVSSVEEMEGRRYMRLMRPLVTEKGCLKCHAEQGYKIGDVRGGISVSIPMSPLRAIARSQRLHLIAGHGLLLLVGLMGIGFGSRRLKIQIARRREAEESLRKTLDVAEEANEKIRDSIQYARTIQASLLTKLDTAKTYLPRSFFIWMPRDIVGGDIFHTENFGHGFIVAVVDCTGHSVPGAFMTMIASSGLRKITRDEKCHDPAEILNRLNLFVKAALQQDTGNAVSDDGMDAAVCFVRPSQGMLVFAGARLPLFHASRGRIRRIQGDRQSLGYKQSRRSDINFTFSDKHIPIRQGDAFYLASDGFEDQLGPSGGSRFGLSSFGRKRFVSLLEEVGDLPFEKQRESLLRALEEHRRGYERQDDVTVVGFGF